MMNRQNFGRRSGVIIDVCKGHGVWFEPGELSAVLLVGGSSRIPLVARMVSAELGRPTVVDTHPKHAVALGAATLADEAAANAVPPADPVTGTPSTTET